MEQTNPYITQFPDLFKGKKILYVHGFASSGQSGTVTRIRTVLPEAEVVAPDLPLEPEEALALLRKVCEQEQPDLIIGTSMGGMFSEMLRGYDRILVNPALRMGDTMKDHGMMGAQHFQNPRQDGVQDFIVTKALVKSYKEITEHCFESITEEERHRVWGLFGDEDDLVDTYGLFHEHYPLAVSFHGEHRMNDQSFMHAVVPVIRWIDDLQEGRQRPIIYIGIETLMDDHGKPRSSSQKTIRTLLADYQLYFVAPAPPEAEAYKEVNDWLRQYVNVPAFRHTVFTNQRPLLYGDYFIGTDEDWDGMATQIRFGSDTFKTWDDVADYFNRLGGQ
jgi:predicted esterase YcpF (UPF0227 family)